MKWLLWVGFAGWLLACAVIGTAAWGAPSADAPEEKQQEVLCMPYDVMTEVMKSSGFQFVASGGKLMVFVHPPTEDLAVWIVVKPEVCLVGKWEKKI